MQSTGVSVLPGRRAQTRGDGARGVGRPHLAFKGDVRAAVQGSPQRHSVRAVLHCSGKVIIVTNVVRVVHASTLDCHLARVQQFAAQRGRPRGDLPALVHALGLEQLVLNQPWTELSVGDSTAVLGLPKLLSPLCKMNHRPCMHWAMTYVWPSCPVHKRRSTPSAGLSSSACCSLESSESPSSSEPVSKREKSS